MYVRAKQRGSRTYYYLVETERVGGMPMQTVVGYLGIFPTVPLAVAGFNALADDLDREAVKLRAEADEIRRGLPAWARVGRGVRRKLPKYSPEPLAMVTPWHPPRVPGHRVKVSHARYFRRRERADHLDRKATDLRARADRLEMLDET